MTIPNEIQMGEITHHQDHAITPQSFSTMNAIVSAPAKPRPAEREDEDADAVVFICLCLVKLLTKTRSCQAGLD